MTQPASRKIDKQDFEAYAEEKPFNASTNPVWERLFARFSAGRQGKGVKILDYGCGDGKHLPRFTATGFPRESVYGVEVSKTRVERCRAQGWEKVFHVDFNQKMPFEGGMFDFVNFMEVIEHIPAGEIDFYLQEIRRVMKKDGLFLVSTPNYPVKRFNDFFNVIVNRMWKRIWDDPTHVTFYTPKRLKARLQKFFPHVEILCYKEGVFYPRIKHPFFMHKIIAVASPSALPLSLFEDEISAI